MNQGLDVEEFNRLLALQLKSGRLKVGISINELSQLSGLSRTAIRQIEELESVPQTSSFAKFAYAIGTTPATVLQNIELILNNPESLEHSQILPDVQERVLQKLRRKCLQDAEFASALLKIF